MFWHPNTALGVFIKVTLITKAKNLNIDFYCQQLITILLTVPCPNNPFLQNNSSSSSDTASFFSPFVRSSTPEMSAVFHVFFPYTAKYFEPFKYSKTLFILKVRLKIKTNTVQFYMHMATSCPYNPKNRMCMRPSPPLNASLNLIRYHTPLVEDGGRLICHPLGKLNKPVVER